MTEQTKTGPPPKTVPERRSTKRRQYSAEEKLRIVMAGLRGEETVERRPIAQHCSAHNGRNPGAATGQRMPGQQLFTAAGASCGIRSGASLHQSERQLCFVQQNYNHPGHLGRTTIPTNRPRISRCSATTSTMFWRNLSIKTSCWSIKQHRESPN